MPWSSALTCLPARQLCLLLIIVAIPTQMPPQDYCVPAGALHRGPAKGHGQGALRLGACLLHSAPALSLAQPCAATACACRQPELPAQPSATCRSGTGRLHRQDSSLQVRDSLSSCSRRQRPGSRRQTCWPCCSSGIQTPPACTLWRTSWAPWTRWPPQPRRAAGRQRQCYCCCACAVRHGLVHVLHRSSAMP